MDDQFGYQILSSLQEISTLLRQILTQLNKLNEATQKRLTEEPPRS